MDEQRKELAKAKHAIIQDYLTTFSGEEGDNVVLDLMEKGFILKPTAANTEREATLNEGKREMVLYILSMLKYDVSKLMELISDNKKEDKTTNNREDANAIDFDFFND